MGRDSWYENSSGILFLWFRGCMHPSQEWLNDAIDIVFCPGQLYNYIFKTWELLSEYHLVKQKRTTVHDTKTQVKDIVQHNSMLNCKLHTVVTSLYDSYQVEVKWVKKVQLFFIYNFRKNKNYYSILSVDLYCEMQGVCLGCVDLLFNTL